MSAVPTVADTGTPLSVIIQAERDAARTFGLAAGLLIGGASQAEGALRTLDTGIGLIEQAAREGASPASVTAYATRLEREAAHLLARLVAARVNAATPEHRDAA
ncbi:hypothetical protein H0176_23705 [Methylorubrum populi]|jgi:hypothetical protein|uniref:hypothetical protein n=1 Tax=Methylorubrum rhodesianum TaxID=29427 RepID=UPI00105425D9|nr:hypothetical protein [Methylorubrum rhodesianum]MBK3406256.1 hypothetical protein [Methylorubrum rhodesianum]MBY0143250.1 hypothetical protein [Methylorubrum populi]